MQAMPTKVPCPRCGHPVTWDSGSPNRPFCSERCKLIDLGAWLDESHRIPSPLEPTDEEDAPAAGGQLTH